jgi:hypothetical protein
MSMTSIKLPDTFWKKFPSHRERHRVFRAGEHLQPAWAQVTAAVDAS